MTDLKLDFQFKINAAQFERWCNNMSAKIRERVAQRAANAGARVFREAVKDMIVHKDVFDKGTMYWAVYSGKSKFRWPDGIVASYVGIRGGRKARTKGALNTATKYGVGADAYYWRWVETGHLKRSKSIETQMREARLTGRRSRAWVRQQRQGESKTYAAHFQRDAFAVAQQRAVDAFFKVVDREVKKYAKENP